MLKKSLLSAAMAASLMGLAATAAQAQIYVEIGPPAPRHEVIPHDRPGYVWVPGHYEWRGERYVWQRGHWVADRPGYAFVEPRWVQRANGQWYLVGNYWERDERPGRRWGQRDMDRDGVPNARDRDRDGDGIANHRDPNPNRYNANAMGARGDLDGDGIRNRRDRDRDGDGVRNRDDSNPRNPYRN